MPDQPPNRAERAFDDLSQAKQDLLKTVAPELHAALARNQQALRDANRSTACALGGPECAAAGRVAVGRHRRDGHPACEQCLEKYADRPGGWPLNREE